MQRIVFNRQNKDHYRKFTILRGYKVSRETISDRQGIAIIVFFMTGTSTAQLYGTAARQDLWLSLILSVLFSLPMALLFAYLHEKFQGKNLFDIIEICFGEFIGKAIIILFLWYTFFIGAMVIVNIGYFAKTVTLPETPRIVVQCCKIFLCIWIVKEGIEVIGRWSELFSILYYVVIVIAILLLIPKMDIKNLTPVLYHGINPVLYGAFLTFTFPFGEIVVFSMVFSSFMNKKSPYRIYIKGLLISGMIVLFISLTTIMVLGINNALSLYYPTYSAISRIDILNFLQRLEILSATVFILGAFIKASIYLLACCIGISKIFKKTDYRFIVIPTALFFLNLSYFSFDSIMSFFEWNAEIFPYYVIPFQIFLPLIILITAFFKKNPAQS